MPLAQGYIHLLPRMLDFLAGSRQIVRYHDVTSGSQITWNNGPGPHVKSGELVRAGEELFNITIMKQEKAVFSPVHGIVKRVLKTADYKHDKTMEPVKEGELLVVLGPVPRLCHHCKARLRVSSFRFCPMCGKKIEPKQG